ncbi:MAG: hypothetical protein WA655_11000 [Candidatus Korobacteraceae bacterium]
MPTRRKTPIVLWILLAVAVVFVVGVVSLLTVPAPIEVWLQGRVVEALREHYGRDVRLQNLHVTLIPEFGATADNFVLPNRGNGEFPPLITVKHITMRAGLPELLRTPVHISWLRLEGLEIYVPPKQEPGAGAAAGKPKQHTRLANFDIDKVDADGAQLYILRRDPRREPLQFELRRLKLRSAGVGQPMTFKAELTNPTPPGLIETTGRFGPWDFDEPSDTRVNGHYTFQHADLSVFNGISGILSSVGDYTGVLRNIVVDGTTDTPDFELDRGGQSVHLTTVFHAVVDGTNGNTYLQPVKAHFLNSDIVTRGEVANPPGVKGKTITLDTDIENARLQDVLTLAAKSEPPAVTGRLTLKAKLQIPPGKDPVLQKMLLDGKFGVTGAHFTHHKVKSAIAELSRRGQGKPEDDSITDVPADFSGDFDLRHATLTFSRLQFVVQGAAAQMRGSYGLHSEAVDFVGDVRLSARISETVQGIGHWVLIPFDPLFMKHGAGTYLPVEITGTRDHPDVRLQLGKIF